ncbi:hypothetical protein [Clostridium beijerinckii]|nr:hypothetical protein [Clostridium beijerinckii]MBA8937754.1 hypothetical protein [Clostridium beijerinckii]NRU41630.1 hypothetical protein [Clostridium beijerinckii]NSB00826.1 hypothetical protein [Clostridium beijerinckii]OOM52630.1 hypothetical protein CLOBI_53250 [Clostridium beijerinckii]OOM65605.1 hypothetical protein CLBEIC_50910 [Clostridium beijerinckii]
MNDKPSRVLDGSNEQTTKSLKEWMGLDENQDFDEYEEEENKEK